MKREKILEKLSRIISTIEKNALPLNVKEIHIFGGLLHGKTHTDDLDLIIISNTLTEKQREYQVDSMFGKHGTLEQKMSRMLKTSNAEKVKILYSHDIEDLKKDHTIGTTKKIWSKEDTNWLVKIPTTSDDILGVRLEEINYLRYIIDKNILVQLTYFNMYKKGSIKSILRDSLPNINDELFDMFYDNVRLYERIRPTLIKEINKQVIKKSHKEIKTQLHILINR